MVIATAAFHICKERAQSVGKNHHVQAVETWTHIKTGVYCLSMSCGPAPKPPKLVYAGHRGFEFGYLVHLMW